ncbi:MAG: hypothetical protein WC959_11635 [Kiritimatiellales bacterium]
MNIITLLTVLVTLLCAGYTLTIYGTTGCRATAPVCCGNTPASGEGSIAGVPDFSDYC